MYIQQPINCFINAANGFAANARMANVFFRHKGSKARRNTKECSEWFFAMNVRMNCSPLPLGEGLGVRLFSPRRLEGRKKHEGMQRMGFATNARMIMECVIFDVMFQRSTSLIRTISTEKLRAINKEIL